MNRLKAILDGEVKPGVYRFSSRAAPQRIMREAEQSGWMCFYLDGREIVDKASFLRSTARAMRFPPEHARNWDAFEEGVRDLSWARLQTSEKGYIVLFDEVARLARENPDDWKTARGIFANAVEEWRAHDTAMIVLLRGANVVAGDLDLV